MRKGQLAEHLTKVPLFAACGRGDLKILARHITEVEVPAGATVVTEGDHGDAFYVIIDGEADVLTSNARGAAKLVATLRPGAWFGELAVLDAAPRNATVIASTSLVVGVLGARVFRAVLRDVPALTEKLLAGMARRLREADRMQNDGGGEGIVPERRGASSRTSVAKAAPRPPRGQRTARSAGSFTR